MKFGIFSKIWKKYSSFLKFYYHLKFDKNGRNRLITSFGLKILLLIILCFTANWILHKFNSNVTRVAMDVLEVRFPETNHSELNGTQPAVKSTTKKILFWTDNFGDKDFGVGFGNGHFIKHKCPVQDCISIPYENNSYPMSEIDALIFHPASDKNYFPEVRHPHTRYVFFFLESPASQCKMFGCNNTKYNNIFNYTMTYRTDSDVYVSWGEFFKRTEPLSQLPDLREKMRTKKKMIAWMVSDCYPRSQRQKIGESLQKLIPVDVYGRCGKLICSRKENSKCMRMIEKKYKFHLSFENSLCQDYMTEKVYNFASLYIVPIVYGLVDYKSRAPHKSFIDVKDFKNIKELANYLKYLDKNDTAYMEYFEWKKDYGVRSKYASSWCDLCAKLHQDTTTKVYDDFYGWYEKDRCVNPQPFLSKFLK